MATRKEEHYQQKLRSTLSQIQRFSVSQTKNNLHASPIGISLISFCKYKNKRELQKYRKQQSRKENIENQLKIQIFKKIKHTVNYRNQYNGLAITKVQIQSNQSKSKQNISTQRSENQQNQLVGKNQNIGNNILKKRKILSLRKDNFSLHRNNIKTEEMNCNSCRPFSAYTQFFISSHRHKMKSLDMKFKTQRKYAQSQTQINGWIIPIQNDEF